MKLSVVFILILFGLAHAGNEVNNGSGLAERNVIFAYVNLDKVIGGCLVSNYCNLSDEELKVLAKIKQALPAEYGVQNQIQFLSNQEYPGFFIIDGRSKVAKTGDEVGDKIYFNTDFLYTKNALGHEQAMTIADATLILIHELGHHHGIKDHAYLDLLGSKVIQHFTKFITEINFFPYSNNLTITIINSPDRQEKSKVLLSASGEVFDISNVLVKDVYCERHVNSPASPVMTRPLGFGLHNVHWGKMIKLDQAEDKFLVNVEANLALFCPSDFAPQGVPNLNYKINMDFIVQAIVNSELNRYEWLYTGDPIALSQHHFPWWTGNQRPMSASPTNQGGEQAPLIIPINF